MQNVAHALVTLAGEWPLWLPVIVGGLAVYLLLPRPRPYPWYAGALAGGLALFLAAALLLRTSGLSPETVLFYAFSGLAVVGAALLVTQHNPGRAALSFTIVVLSTCGLFLLLAAPFLMAATVIIYAGAIIVTFLFVLMLAQQAGLSDADARSREPVFATLTGFLLLAAMLYVLNGPPAHVLDDLRHRARLALQQDTRTDTLRQVEPAQTDRDHGRTGPHRPRPRARGPAAVQANRDPSPGRRPARPGEGGPPRQRPLGHRRGGRAGRGREGVQGRVGEASGDPGRERRPHPRAPD